MTTGAGGQGVVERPAVCVGEGGGVSSIVRRWLSVSLSHSSDCHSEGAGPLARTLRIAWGSEGGVPSNLKCTCRRRGPVRVLRQVQVSDQLGEGDLGGEVYGSSLLLRQLQVSSSHSLPPPL